MATWELGNITGESSNAVGLIPGGIVRHGDNAAGEHELEPTGPAAVWILSALNPHFAARLSAMLRLLSSIINVGISFSSPLSISSWAGSSIDLPGCGWLVESHVVDGGRRWQSREWKKGFMVVVKFTMRRFQLRRKWSRNWAENYWEWVRERDRVCSVFGFGFLIMAWEKSVVWNGNSNG